MGRGLTAVKFQPIEDYECPKMMDLSQRKEQFSHAYVRAVASVAGFSAAIPEVDDDSVDLILSGRSASGIPCRPRIEFQLKWLSEPGDFAVLDE